MIISDLANVIPATVLTGEVEHDPPVSDVFCCDLLSRVMANAKKDGIWITVLTHMNIVAVAQLAEVGCVVIPDAIEVPEQTIAKAGEENINILSTPLSAYEICWRVHDALVSNAPQPL